MPNELSSAPTGKAGERPSVETVDLRLAIALALALAAWHVAVAAAAELNSDEAYYWIWSLHPAISYYDHPPMVAWWIAASTALFGENALAIRLPTILAVLGTGWVTYATARVLFDGIVASRAFLWFNVTFLVALGGLFATPDAPAGLFWALAFLAFARLVRSKDGRWFLAVGLFAGLGLLSKYNDLFLGLGIVLCLVVDRDLRRWWKSPYLWAGGLIATLLFLPVLWWNYRHGWVSFALQFGRIPADQLAPVNLLGLLGTLIALPNPFIALFAGIGILAWLRGRPNPWRREIGLVAAWVAPLLVYMVIHATHDRVDGNWLAPIFPGIVLIAAAAAETIPGSGTGQGVLRVLRLATPALGAAVGIVGLLILVAPPRFLEGTLNPFRGWTQLTRDTESLRMAAGAGWIATNDYNLAAEFTFELLGTGVPVEQINQHIRYAFAPPPDLRLLEMPALLVLRRSSASAFADCFGQLEPVGELLRGPPGKPFTKYSAYLASKPRADIFSLECERPAAN